MKAMTPSLRFFLFAALALPGQDSPATRRLKQRNLELAPAIVHVAEGVYAAVGYTVSVNCMIVGETGVIIIDPGQSIAGSRRVREEFAKITNKPVSAIICTHSRADHTGGAPAFVDPDKTIPIWARANFGSEAATVQAAGIRVGVRPVNTQGFDVPPEKRLGIGIAIPPNRPPAGSGMMRDGVANLPGAAQAPEARPMPPTHQFSEERRKLEIAGVQLELVAAPGETDDQLYVWLPSQRVVFSGDNFYQSWPNTYPLRGSARRDIRMWADSVDKIVQENPLHLVGGHTKPILNDARKVLENYRDALRFVHQKTMEGAEKFLTPDELVEYVKLPPEFAQLDYLGDYYGSVAGTVREIYAQHVGWFDGDPLNLHRLPPREQSERMAALAGGAQGLLEKARTALAANDAVWAAQLAQHAMRLQPAAKEPKLLLAEALDKIAEKTFNAPSRNYTFAFAARLRREAAGERP
ncbi:MAG: alkyl/aryl-sulfatase [Acidobacteria bacterium]|nr:alkyl/aryl-sulfatase [Acidobacteriota bacterium]